VCVPYAGGGAAIFRAWRLADAEILAARLPGRENRLREAPLRTIAEMADHLAEAARLFAEELPVALFGHSMGALVAFELARRLTASGAGPLLLIASASAAPSIGRDADPLHTLDDEQLIARLEEAFGDLPAEVKNSRELMQMILPLLRADLEADETYEYRSGEPLACPILVLAGTDEELDDEALAGWSRETTGAVQVRRVAGDHFFIRTAPDAVLRMVQDAIASALRDR
jgi:medium-chain acyl-[acyl-carrier-protein] hydrolase